MIWGDTGEGDEAFPSLREISQSQALESGQGRVEGLGRIDDSEPEPSISANIQPQAGLPGPPLIDHRVELDAKSQNASSDSSDEEDEDGWRLVILDVSALMWAPRSVRRLLRREWEAIVPMEGESTVFLPLCERLIPSYTYFGYTQERQFACCSRSSECSSIRRTLFEAVQALQHRFPRFGGHRRLFVSRDICPWPRTTDPKFQ